MIVILAGAKEFDRGCGQEISLDTALCALLLATTISVNPVCGQVATSGVSPPGRARLEQLVEANAAALYAYQYF